MATAYDFRGKTALVTGGASGIGEACVLAFARGGANVLVADLNAELGEKVVAAAKQAGGDARFAQVDVSVPSSVASMVEAALQAFGRLDIAVNNAGIGGESKPTGEYSLESWHKVIGVNLDGVFYQRTRLSAPVLRHGGRAGWSATATTVPLIAGFSAIRQNSWVWNSRACAKPSNTS